MADYTLVVGAFRHPNDAEYALPSVKQAAKDQGLKVHDAAIVSRSEAGEVQIKDTGDWGFVKGALAGGAVTGAVALIAGPIGWGALAAAGLAGGVIAKVRDAGIKDDALRDLGAQAKQAASALVLMVDPAGEAAHRRGADGGGGGGDDGRPGRGDGRPAGRGRRRGPGARRHPERGGDRPARRRDDDRP